MIGQGSEAGVWGLEAMALAAAGLLGYVLMRREFGAAPALLGSAAWMATVGYAIRPGNYTEEFGLPLQFGALLLFAQYESGRVGRSNLVGVGGTLATLILLRPNNAAVPLSVLVFLMAEAIGSERRRRRLKDVVAILVGASIVLACALSYFAAQGALAELWDAVVVYNARYAQAGLAARLDAMSEGLRLLAPSGLGAMGIIGWGTCVVRWLWADGRDEPSSIQRVLVIGLVAEFAMVAAAGRSLNHYYATWLPVLSVLSASVIGQLLIRVHGQGRPALARALMWGVIVAGVCLVPARDLAGQVNQLRLVGPRDARPTSQEILAIGGVTDTLLMWGAETTFNYLLDIPAPTRYVYQYPLYTCGYTTPERVDEVAADIRRAAPLIVDTSNENALVPPIDTAKREAWKSKMEGCSLTEAMDALLAELNARYEAVGTMPTTGWTVYAPRAAGVDS